MLIRLCSGPQKKATKRSCGCASSGEPSLIGLWPTPQILVKKQSCGCASSGAPPILIRLWPWPQKAVMWESCSCATTGGCYHVDRVMTLAADKCYEAIVRLCLDWGASNVEGAVARAMETATKQSCGCASSGVPPLMGYVLGHETIMLQCLKWAPRMIRLWPSREIRSRSNRTIAIRVGCYRCQLGHGSGLGGRPQNNREAVSRLGCYQK